MIWQCAQEKNSVGLSPDRGESGAQGGITFWANQTKGDWMRMGSKRVLIGSSGVRRSDLGVKGKDRRG